MEASSTEWDWLETGLKSEGKVKLLDPTKFTESQCFDVVSKSTKFKSERV